MCTVHVKKMLRRKKLQVKKNPKIENKERKLVDWHHYNRYEQMKKEIKKLNEIRTSGIIAHLYITNYVFFNLFCEIIVLFNSLNVSSRCREHEKKANFLSI